ncbi:MAG TPA: hypothetical protein VGF91_32905 [Solirubrobacteraceae bacterium]|jgi:hypothetical protein
MSSGERDRISAFEANHAAIIARTLRWADEAAARRDYAQAVRWIETIRSLGDSVSDEYEAKHRRWLDAIEPQRRRGPR